MTIFIQGLLFLSSYSPLLAVFGLLNTFGVACLTTGCFVLAGLGAASTPLLLLVDRGTQGSALAAKEASPRDSDVLAYVATYLVPFAQFGSTTVQQKAAIALFVVLIAVLYIRLQLFYVNPLLALFGYRTYQVMTQGGTSVILLSRRSFVQPGSTMSAVRLSNYVWREKQ